MTRWEYCEAVWQAEQSARERLERDKAEHPQDWAAASPLEGQAKPQARVTGRFPDLNNAFAANCFIE